MTWLIYGMASEGCIGLKFVNVGNHYAYSEASLILLSERRAADPILLIDSTLTAG